MKILVAGFGIVAQSIVKSLLNNFCLKKEQIICFTYDVKDNESFINFLKESEIIYYFDSLSSDFSNELVKDFSPDYIASLYYRDIIPKSILDLARVMSFNVHPSLLPKFKGCFSAPWAIIEGESHTGVTFHQMIEKVDRGQILWQKEISITKSDTGYSLYHKLCAEAIREFDLFFACLSNGDLIPKPMKMGGSFYKREVPYGGVINQNWSTDAIDRFIRGMFFPPFRGATLFREGESIEISTIEQYLKIVSEGYS